MTFDKPTDQRGEPRSPKQLLIASKEFASEHRLLSWWHLWSTLAVCFALIGVSVSDLSLWLRIPASIAVGLVTVRLFIIYHDFQHSAILAKSVLARWIMATYGMLVLAPTSVWKHSHDVHHRKNSQTFGANVGSYPIMTTHAYANAMASEKFSYAASRHPLTIVLGYFTVFIWRMCLQAFISNPREHFDGGVSILLHIALAIGLLMFGVDIMMLGLIVPLFVASGLGAYLFYAQHNYPSAKMHPSSEWSHVDAALQSSSFIPMNPLMNWFTGNIGYHHVHHLNARIPFYRLPEAMAALPELQTPGVTTLRPGDIAACLRLKLWCPDQEKFVGFNGV
ncbi:Fatty acid desaturase [Rosistilla oblonga]|uniref:Fatty acid desaturase n=1 Tax=Rosistilla oblonga TaxID=2527990 RepID=A0A518IZ62_9BACT|nr:fatty acid desaturase [Rosistilla oblonga]QDV13429.1 Fatty acid desaturase [Rosistilla oblonga]QDV58377.1 Fatty acid desaturase [Rosistilla oblonga]